LEYKKIRLQIARMHCHGRRAEKKENSDKKKRKRKK